MKFRTEIEVAPWQKPIDYTDKITCIGSCFASNIAERLRRHKFNVVASPTGILFNPASIAQAVEMMTDSYEGRCVVDRDMMIKLDGRYVNYDFHSAVSGATAEEAMQLMQRALVEGGHHLLGSDLVIITLGTAWCYVHRDSQRVVANCHKQPSALFERRLMSVAEVVEALQRAIERINGRVLFTVSPVRHMGEGMEDNSLSKAILRVAVNEVCAMYDYGVDYFPAYEIMLDDLRDYRFYEPNMVHPTGQAVDYITEKFFDAALSTTARSTMQRISKVVAAAEHRAFNPSGEGYKNFCRAQLKEIAALEYVDLSKEKEFFERMLGINE